MAGKNTLGSDAEAEENMIKEARGVCPGGSSNWLRSVWPVDIHQCCWQWDVRAPPDPEVPHFSAHGCTF